MMHNRAVFGTNSHPRMKPRFRCFFWSGSRFLPWPPTRQRANKIGGAARRHVGSAGSAQNPGAVGRRPTGDWHRILRLVYNQPQCRSNTAFFRRN
jgi:hypothetical protein